MEICVNSIDWSLHHFTCNWKSSSSSCQGAPCYNTWCWCQPVLWNPREEHQPASSEIYIFWDSTSCSSVKYIIMIKSSSLLSSPSWQRSSPLRCQVVKLLHTESKKGKHWLYFLVGSRVILNQENWNIYQTVSTSSQIIFRWLPTLATLSRGSAPWRSFWTTGQRNILTWLRRCRRGWRWGGLMMIYGSKEFGWEEKELT